jgi:hypothetical protein
MARFTSVIEPLPLLSTDPLVLRARVWTPVGARVAVTLMFPEFVPLRAPIRKVPADTRFTSADVIESRLDTSVPKSITLLLVCGDTVTTPLAEVVPIVASRLSMLVVNKTSVAAITFLAKDKVAAVEARETDPEVDVTVALDPEVVVIFPDPEMVMLPTAWIAAVGATEVPPLRVTVPADVKVPEPTYVPDGVMVMFPEFVVV